MVAKGVEMPAAANKHLFHDVDMQFGFRATARAGAAALQARSAMAFDCMDGPWAAAQRAAF